MDTSWQNTSLQFALNSIRQEASRETRDEIVRNMREYALNDERLALRFTPEEMELAKETIQFMATMIELENL